MDNTIIVMITLIFFIALLWVVFSEVNFRLTMRTIISYQNIERTYRNFEKEFENTSIRADYFLQRMRLKEKYPEIDSMSEGLKKNEKAFKKQLRKEYYKVGFIYNLYNQERVI